MRRKFATRHKKNMRGGRLPTWLKKAGAFSKKYKLLSGALGVGSALSGPFAVPLGLAAAGTRYAGYGRKRPLRRQSMRMIGHRY